MITDVHTHIYSDEALASYRAGAGDRVSKIITYPYFKDDTELRDLDTTLDFAARHDNVYVVGTVDMDGDIPSQLERMRKLFQEKRIVGIKLYPGYQHFYPHDEIVDPIAELCGEFNKPLIFHGGITHSEIKGTILKYSQPEHVDEIAVRHPYTNFIICHFGFPDYMDCATVLSDNDNVYSEISGIVYGTPGEGLDSMIRQNVTDLKRVMNYFNNSPDIREKVMFGTDFIGGSGSLQIVEPYMRLVEELFDPSFHAQVYHDLAEKIYFS